MRLLNTEDLGLAPSGKALSRTTSKQKAEPSTPGQGAGKGIVVEPQTRVVKSVTSTEASVIGNATASKTDAVLSVAQEILRKEETALAAACGARAAVPAKEVVATELRSSAMSFTSANRPSRVARSARASEYAAT